MLYAMGVFSACLVMLAFVIATEGRQCYRNGKYHAPGTTWVEPPCKFRCTCLGGGRGRYRCVSLCYNLFKTTCGRNEITKYRKVTVLGSKCQCNEPYCVKKPKATKRPDVCISNGQRYNVGESYIDGNCKWRCRCYSGGRTSCRSVCPSYTVRCPANKKKVFRRVAAVGASRCFCNRPTCVRKSKPRCYANGKFYNSGQSWIDSTCAWRCTCGERGRYNCVGLCTRNYRLRCSSNQVKRLKDVTIPGSDCKCKKAVCEENLSRVCAYEGKRYYQDQRFTNAACTERCRCNPGGRVSCGVMCLPHFANCGPNQIEKDKQVPAVPGSSCYCNRPICVDKPKPIRCHYPRDDTYHNTGQSWIDLSCSNRCSCDNTGRYKCRSLCPSQAMTCGWNQVKRITRENVAGSKCKCTKQVCVNKPKKVRCQYNGKLYDAGQRWIDSKCSWRCYCDISGRYRCTSLCKSYQVWCASDQIKITQTIKVQGSKCTCKIPVCVKRQNVNPQASCTDQGKVYAVGQSFINQACTGRCKCNRGGRTSCVSLCPPVNIVCGRGQTKKYRQVAVSGSKCSCNRPYCEDPAYCSFGGNRYRVGESFVDSSCRWSCNCNARGIHNCVSACTYNSVRCPPRHFKRVRRYPVKNSNKCYCKVEYCSRT